MKRKKQKRVIPGFGLTLGITLSVLGLIVIIPLCSLIIFSAQMSIGDFIGVVTKPRVLSAYLVSFETAFIAAFIDAVMGLILAWVLVRYEFAGKQLMNGIIELPFALPTAVAGISLAHLTTTNGWVGSFFAKFGLELAYTRVGIIIALVFVGIPFVVRTVQPVLEKIDPQYEEAAYSLGASKFQTIRQVVFPEVLPALIGGFTLSFARGLGEYGSVVFIAGNTPYKTEIAPLMIMSKLQSFDYASATSIALVMLLAAFIILFINAIIQNRSAKIVQKGA
ncbi:Sulfate transport system permease protein CysT [Lachnospiraceae bacterium TWA4]|nr:Sulfate transport system permease protein CysT [Lachnospiraceae bacterium TWA4]